MLDGLKPFAYNELAQRFGERAVEYTARQDESDAILLRYSGDLHELLTLRLIAAAFLVHTFPIGNPRLLLNSTHFPALAAAIDAVCRLHPAQTFRTFTISAAGSDSSTFMALRSQITASTGLVYAPGEADLLLRIRPSQVKKEGWDVLIRLSPRPLATRSWRVYNLLGALNATIAAAMVELAYPKPRDRFLNVMCGSGTLLIERLRRCPAQLAVGCDLDRDILAGAALNLHAAGLENSARLVRMDATALDFPDDSFDVICGDLPWGQLVGSHAGNIALYPKLLREVARVTAPGARLVLLTHEIKLMDELSAADPTWVLRDVVKVFQGGLHPRIYLLQRAH